MTAATKTKKTKIGNATPPVEIRENTKARRAWLSEKQAEYIRDGFEAKIVGQGSYQQVSIYRVEQIAGRLRHRGHCQFCGNAQVVDGGALVLHGYSRPGIGYVFNECPGVNRPPLELSEDLTKIYLQAAVDHSAAVNAKLELAQIENKAASAVRFGSDNFELNGFTTQPHFPGRHATSEQIAAHKIAVRDWAARFPITARYVRADRAEAELRNEAWKAKQQVDHFTSLLARKLLGQALIEEVVA